MTLHFKGSVNLDELDTLPKKVEDVEEVFGRRASVQGMEMVYEPRYTRFFQAHFEKLT